MDEFIDFPIEFSNEADFDQKPNSEFEERLFAEAETRLRELAKGHTDLTGAYVHFQQPIHGKGTTYLYEARVTVFIRPDDISVTKEHSDPMVALKSTLDVVERLIREERRRLRDLQRTPNNMSPEETDLT
jgi:ribosome-associated translation inhibitor RaiA